MKKLALIAIIPLLFLSVFSFPSKAEENLEEEDVAQEVTDNIKQRLQDTIDDPSVLAATSEDNSPRAYFGTVQDIIQNNITINTKDGPKYASPAEDVTIIRSPGNSIIKATNIQIDDFIIAMGYLQEAEHLEATRIIVSQDISSGLDKTTGRATITDISNTSLTLSDDTNDSPTLYLSSKTTVKSKSEVIDIEDLVIGDVIIYTASIDDDNDLTATIIMLTGISDNLTSDE